MVNKQSAAPAVAPPMEAIAGRILVIRGHKVMIDADIAELYGVTTKRLNEQVKRNKERFPEDFMFQLTPAEKAEVVANCDHLAKLKFSRTPPFAFTEHGALMAASVLNTPHAVQVSLYVTRAFVQLRNLFASNQEVLQKLNDLERKVASHDQAIAGVITTIRQLMAPPEPGDKRPIGFVAPQEKPGARKAAKGRK